MQQVLLNDKWKLELYRRSLNIYNFTCPVIYENGICSSYIEIKFQPFGYS